MDTSHLEGIGLTNAEVKVYLALLSLGSSKTGPIIEKSGLQSSVVYTSLAKLIEKGFASSIKEGKMKYYQATDPKNIIQYIDEKKRNVEALIPQLISRQMMAKERPEATLFRGVRGVKELLLELLEAGGKEHHTLGSPKESTMMGDAWWVNYHKKRASKGIAAKLIFNESLRKWAKEVKYNERFTEVRFTRQGFEPLTETIIRNDKVGIIIWTEKPIGVLIHNKILADSYNEFFELIWKTARHYS